MIPCLSEYTVVSAPRERFLQGAEKAGFPAVELSWRTVMAAIRNDDVGSLARTVAAHNLKVASINGPDLPNLPPEDDFRSVLLETDAVVSAAKTLGCSTLMPCAAPMKTDLSQDVAIDQTVTILQRMADACGDDFRLAFEFVGLNSFSVKDLRTASQVIRRVGRKNVGILVDAFHMYLQNTPFSEVVELEKNKLFFVHLNDAKSGPREGLNDGDRVYPGQGVMNLGELRSSLSKVGYEGYLCLELFNQEYWKDDPQAVAERGRRSITETFGV